VRVVAEGGQVLPVTVYPVGGGYGPDTLVWQVDTGYRPSTPDQSYEVTVSGVRRDWEELTHRYTVRLFDAARDGAQVSLPAPTSTGRPAEEPASPRLLAFDISPSTVDVLDGPATVVVTARVTDATGVVPPTLEVRNEARDQWAWSTSSSMTLVGGDARDGTYRQEFTVQDFAKAGTWSALIYPLTDTAGNRGAYDVPHDFTDTFTVTRNGTPTTRPGAPTAVTALPAAAAAQLSWSAPAGVVADTYRVTSVPDGRSATVPGSATTARLTGLANGTRYTFTVTATNAAGTGPASGAVSATPDGCAPTRFSDVAADHPFCEQIGWMVSRSVSTGTVLPDGSVEYRPALAVSRQAMAPFLYRAAGSPTFTAPATASFADVATTHPFFREIEWMRAEGISTGTAQPTGKPLYKPADPVSRQAMAPFLYRAASSPSFTAPRGASFADVPTTHSFFREIEWMKATGISTGTAQPGALPLYKPADPVSRQAMAAFLQRSDALS